MSVMIPRDACIVDDPRTMLTVVPQADIFGCCCDSHIVHTLQITQHYPCVNCCHFSSLGYSSIVVHLTSMLSYPIDHVHRTLVLTRYFVPSELQVIFFFCRIVHLKILQEYDFSRLYLAYFFSLIIREPCVCS